MGLIFVRYCMSSNLIITNKTQSSSDIFALTNFGALYNSRRVVLSEFSFI